MRALRVHGYEPGEGIRCEDIPLPEPGPGELRVRVQACGMSFVDLLWVRGSYQVKPDLPFVPGSEFCGVVDAVGSDGAGALRPGDRVCGAKRGAWSEYLCLPPSQLHRLDEPVAVEEAGVLIAPYSTALYALRERAQLQAGETLLVLGASGAVGRAAVETGKALGARVIAVASSEAKRQSLREAGADHVIDSTGPWKDDVKALTAPGAVNVVMDPLGGAATEAAFRTLAWGGRHLMVGFAGGDIGALKNNLPLLKGASLVGVDVRQAGERQPALLARVRQDVIDLYQQGHLRPFVSDVLPVARFAEAEQRVRDRATLGRVVLTF